MSDNDSKFKNSRRRHADETAIKKQLAIAKQHGMTEYNKTLNTQTNRLNKKHAMDCGKPECMICGNPRRLRKTLTVQERKLFQDLDDKDRQEDQ
jgi:hypothetical protein